MLVSSDWFVFMICRIVSFNTMALINSKYNSNILQNDGFLYVFGKSIANMGKQTVGDVEEKIFLQLDYILVHIIKKSFNFRKKSIQVILKQPKPKSKF